MGGNISWFRNGATGAVLLVCAAATALSGCGGDRPPSAREVARAWEDHARNRGHRTSITIRGLSCTDAGSAPDRLRGPGYFCEFRMEQNPWVFWGPGTSRARFSRVDGSWQVHY